jgi:CreA protein
MLKRLALLACRRCARCRSLPAATTTTNVGSVGVDWTGNDIAVEAVADPEVTTAWSATSPISTAASSTGCSRATGSRTRPIRRWTATASGPITIGDINLARAAKRSSAGRSLIWKSLRVSRIYDAENNALVYLAHARELQLGSGKMSLSVVPLDGAEVTWTKGAPTTR